MTAKRDTGRRGAIGADLAVLAVAMVWGASYPVAKGALAYAPALLLILYRFAITAMLMSAVSWRDLARAPVRDLGVGAILGVILFLIFLAETCGVALTSATNAALIISLCVVMTPFLDYGLSGRLPPKGAVIGALVAIAGAAVLAGGLAGVGTGDMLILAAAMLRAVMVVATRRLTRGRALSSAALTALQSATITTLALAAVLMSGGPSALIVHAGAAFWAAVGFLALFCTVGAFYVQNAAVRRTSPTRVSFLMGTEPVFGVALSWLLLSEPLTAATLLGAGLILVGTSLDMSAERRFVPAVGQAADAA